MLVFIDESGDPGFGKGASPVFVAVMVIFLADKDAAATQAAIAASKARRAHKPEFKFNKCRNDVRDLFFQCVAGCRFSVRAIVVRKRVIYSPRLRANKERFYEYFVKEMMLHDGGALVGAKVIIDGSGAREFRNNLKTALCHRLRAGAIKSLRFKSSQGDVLVQLADMCVGAIARSYRADRRYNDRWSKMLAPRIVDIWDFG
jgi:hypothetical protein